MKIIPLLFVIATFLLLPASSSASGFVKDSLLRSEKVRCQKTAAPKKCLRGAKQRVQKKLTAMMAEKKGLYGFRLPEKFISAKRGQVLWSKKLSGRKFFLLYSSRSYPSGKPVAVSGTLSLPSGKPPRGGWPVISWAHGTTGLADVCAPSLGTSYGDATPFLDLWLSRGYAVAATDYEGLGTPGEHPYLVGMSAGRSVVDILPASRSLAPINLQKTTLIGHSQGGHAVLWASSLIPGQGSVSAPQTVSYAPPALLASQADLIGTQPEDAYSLSALALSILRGAASADRGILPEEVLSEEAFSLYPRTGEVCLDQLGQEAAAANLSPGNLLRPGWKSTASGSKFYQQLQESNPVLKLGKETLLVQGMQDTTVLPLFTSALYSDLSSLNPGRVTYWRFTNGQPDSNTFLLPTPSTHSSILEDSFDLVAGWIK